MKKFLLILSILTVTATQLKAQNKTSPGINLSAQATILRFYPNPATNAITFDFQKGYDKGYSIQVFHFIGRKMLEQTNIANHTTINLSDFPRGVYVFRLFDKTGKLIETGKFQVSK